MSEGRRVKHKLAGTVKKGDVLVCEDLSESTVTGTQVFSGYITIEMDNGEILRDLDPFSHVCEPAPLEAREK